MIPLTQPGGYGGYTPPSRSSSLSSSTSYSPSSNGLVGGGLVRFCSMSCLHAYMLAQLVSTVNHYSAVYQTGSSSRRWHALHISRPVLHVYCVLDWDQRSSGLSGRGCIARLAFSRAWSRAGNLLHAPVTCCRDLSDAVERATVLKL
jgi:hypothetical protein